MQISPAQEKAAGAYVDLIAEKFGSGRAVHCETAIASVGRLAGSLLFRSLRLNVQDVPPGTVVLSQEADEQGAQLIDILASTLRENGIVLRNEGPSKGASRRGGAPELTLLDTLKLVQDDALRIAAENGLGLREAAHAAAMATAFIAKECERRVSPEMAFHLAAYSFVEGSKTMPPDIGGQPAQESAPAKPWYKFW